MIYFKSTLILVCLLYPARLVLAQTQDGLAGHGRLIWVLPQGERLEISQDFKVRLDGRKLRVALETRGVITTEASTELVVALIQPAREPQKVTVRADQPIVFEDVKDGISSLLVLGIDSTLKARSVTYAAFAFFAETPGADVQPAVAAGPQPLQVPIALVSIDRVRNELPNVSTTVNLQGIGDLADYDQRPRNHFRVTRSASGSLAGKIHVPESQYSGTPGEVRVAILRNDVVVAEVASQPDGRFEVRDIELGFYSLFAVGPNGHAAYSFEVVDNEDGAAIPSRAQSAAGRFVRVQVGASNQLDILLIPPSLMDQVVQLVREQYGPPDNERNAQPGAAGLAAANSANNAGSNTGTANAGAGAAGASGAGSGGGGAAAGSGGGAAGALAGLAGIAAGLGVSSNNDGGFSANITTPIAPSGFVSPSDARN